MLRLGATALSILMLLGCDPDEGGTVIPLGDSNRGDGGPSNGGDTAAMAPYNAVTFTHEIVNVDSSAKPAGIQGVLLHGADGTAYYAFLKFVNTADLSCDIAVFGGGPAPAVNHELRVAVRAPADTTWTIETVPLDRVGPPDYAMARYGLSAVINSSGQPVIALAAGQAGLATCGSSDLVLATRTGANAYSLEVPASSSGDCCGAECPDPACTSGTDVGAWAAIALDGSGDLAVAFVDYHNFWDEDGQSWQGYEFWHESDGIFGINPWSGSGRYGDLAFAQNGNTISAFTHFAERGLFVYVRTGNAGSVDDWQSRDLRPGSDIGERISLAVATDGTIGMAFHEKIRRPLSTSTDEFVDDLIYCESDDHGATWKLPCTNIDSAIVNLGHNPSLAFDSTNRPVIAYRYCGPSGSCPASNDGVKLAWRDDDGKWRTKSVVSDASKREGIYVTMSLDPTTDEPLIAYQNLSTGAAMVARGTFP